MNPVPKFNCTYAALDTSTAEEEDDQEDAIDPDSCYSSAPADSLVQEVKKFIGTTFRRSILKQKRLEIANQYPKPDMPATKVPRFNHDTKGALDRDFPDKMDEQMAKIQASVLATCTPLTNFQSNITKEGFKVTKDTLTLIGNASNYITI